MAKLGIFGGCLFFGVGMYLLYKKFNNKNKPLLEGEVKKTMLSQSKINLNSFLAAVLLRWIILIKKPNLSYG